MKKLGKSLIRLFPNLLFFSYLAWISWLFFTDADRFTQIINALTLPVSIVIVSLVFRDTLSNLLGKMTQFKFGQGEVNFDSNRQLSETSSKSIEKTLSAEHPNRSPNLELTRIEIENVMELSAAWGYQMAEIGFKSTPRPLIEWEGKFPRIKFGMTSNSVSSDEKDLLVKEILETKDALDRLGPLDRMQIGLSVSKEAALKKSLIRLQNLLRKIDPDSVFLD